MTPLKKFDVGYGTDYATRPSGMTTYLLVQPYFDSNNVCDDTTCTFHVELCGKSDHDVAVTSKDDTQKFNISAAGALVNVRNTGGWPFNAWTDY